MNQRSLPYLLCCLSILCSALLLFVVQPMASKGLLPYFGGSAGVWGVALVFFQGMLCVGYGYAYLLTNIRSLPIQLAIHAVIGAAALWMAWDVPTTTAPPSLHIAPALSILYALSLGIGLPYFFLTSNNTLMHHWFTRIYGEQRSPYFLYIISNMGSLGALLLYPFVIEPWLPLDTQRLYWTYGFMLFCGVLCATGISTWRFQSPIATQTEEAAPYQLTRSNLLQWWLCAAVPSGLLVATTTHITTDISPMPLLWVVPLALYLLSFILAFRGNMVIGQNMLRAFPFFLCAVIAGKFLLDGKGFALVIIELAALYNFCFLLHARLFHTAPPARAAGLFYLVLSFGGVCGGIFAALLAPLLFNGIYEYYLLLAAVILLKMPWQPFPTKAWGIVFLFSVAIILAKLAVPTFKEGAIALFHWLELNDNVYSPHYPLWQAIPYLALLPFFMAVYVAIWRTERTPLLQVIIMGVTLAISYYGQQHGILWKQRNFYGVKSVKQHPDHQRVHILINGIVNHGAQDLTRPTTSISYYDSALHNIFQLMAARAISYDRIAILGLGTGEMACVVPPHMTVDYYEIDPLVVEIAQNTALFTYMRDCPPPKQVHIGDGRLMIAASPQRYDMIFADAFTSDAIPVHLLTTEAVQAYNKVLSEEGILIFHISNVYFELEQVLAQVAHATGYHAWTQSFISSNKLGSQWVIFTKQPWQASMAARLQWKELLPQRGRTAWSDNYSNMFEALRRGVFIAH